MVLIAIIDYFSRVIFVLRHLIQKKSGMKHTNAERAPNKELLYFKNKYRIQKLLILLFAMLPIRLIAQNTYFNLSTYVSGGTNLIEANYFYKNIGLRSVVKRLPRGEINCNIDYLQSTKLIDYTFYTKNDYTYRYHRQALGLGANISYRINDKWNFCNGMLVYSNFFRKSLRTENDFLKSILLDDVKFKALKIGFTSSINYSISKKSTATFRYTYTHNSYIIRNKDKNILIHDNLLTLGYEYNLF